MDQKYFDTRFREIPEHVVTKAIAVMREVFAEEPELEKEIKSAIKDRGLLEWTEAFPMFHFGMGMYLRNQLRTAQLTDDLLPEHNWDDYYIQVLEAAFGFRDLLRLKIG